MTLVKYKSIDIDRLPEIAKDRTKDNPGSIYRYLLYVEDTCTRLLENQPESLTVGEVLNEHVLSTPIRDSLKSLLNEHHNICADTVITTPERQVV